jgi:hypothetical protein
MEGSIGEANVEGIAVGIGIDGHRRGAKITTCPDQPDGDLSAIGYQDSSEHNLLR